MNCCMLPGVWGFLLGIRAESKGGLADEKQGPFLCHRKLHPVGDCESPTDYERQSRSVQMAMQRNFPSAYSGHVKRQNKTALKSIALYETIMVK